MMKVQVGVRNSPKGSKRPKLSCPSKQVILFLAANPISTGRLALGEEFAAIEGELRLSPHRDRYTLQPRWAVTIDAMLRDLNELSPSVIHFSGHGSRLAEGTDGDVDVNEDVDRDVDLDEGAGIYLHGQGGHDRDHVAGRALARMIAAGAPKARIVVLNACYGDAIAEALCEEVDCVVSMRGPISDAAACAFAAAFYCALVNGRPVANAVEQGRRILKVKHLPGEHLPSFRTRSGLLADQIFL